MSIPKLLCWCVLLIAMSASLGAQASDWVWAKRGGGSDIEYSKSIAVDAAGNSYITGYYKGNAVFGTTTLTGSTSNHDVFVAKADPSGNWLWAKKASGSADDYASGIAIDPAGTYAYVTGSFNSATMTFGSISITRTGTANTDIYVAKLNASTGAWIWATKAGGTQPDNGYGISLDANSNVFVTGDFNGTATFGSLPSLTSSGSNDIFAAKLDNNGIWQWATKAGGAGGEQGNAIGVSPESGIVITGGYKSTTASFGSLQLTNSGDSDVFVARLSEAGAWEWVSKAGGAGLDNAYALSTDPSGNIYLTGVKGNNAMFGAIYLGGTDSYDMFVAKIDAEGTWLWANKSTCPSYDFGYGIFADAWGEVVLTGNFFGTAVFGSTTLTGNAASNSDAFIAKISSGGTWTSAEKLGSSGMDSGYGVYVDASANVYWYGQFSGTVTLESFNLTSNNGSQDIFIAKQANTHISLLAPVGGEQWIAGTAHTINWSSSNIQNILLHYSQDGGASWFAITPDPISAGSGFYNWIVPNINSTTVLVRVQSYENPDLFAMTPQPFSIYIPLTLQSLNDGGAYIANTVQDIVWTANNVNQVSLDYSLDAGENWTQINTAPIPANEGVFPWTLPQTISDESLVRVRDCSNPGINDTSNSPFTIYIPLILQSLNGGENVIYRANTVQAIQWSAMQVNDVYLDYSTDAGATWQPILDTPLPANQGSYDWTLPEITCYCMKVRVRDSVSPDIVAVSSSTFGISLPLTMESMHGGQGIDFAASSAQDIIWTSFMVDQVVLEYSTDSGQTWIPITDEPMPATSQNYTWILPNLTCYNVRVKITEVADPFASVMSQNDFAIIIPPTAPANVDAAPDPTSPENFQLSWDVVLTDVNGDPIQPDGYRIYYCTRASDNLDDYTLLAEVTDGTSFVHSGATQLLGNVFYKVVAFKE